MSRPEKRSFFYKLGRVPFFLLRKIRHIFAYPLAIVNTQINKSRYLRYTELQGAVDPLTLKKICLFAHFDPKNKVADYVIFHVRALHEQGCAVFFITTSASLDQASVDKLRPYVCSILIRQNIGLDFGSYHLGLERTKGYTHHDFLIFANDSVYGPLSSLTPLFDLAEKQGCDVVGVTDSLEIERHIQSYFLVFSKNVFTSKVFTTFFEQFKFSNNKDYVVRQCEVGLSRALLRKGFELKALCDYQTVCAFVQASHPVKKLSRVNALHADWKILIEHFSCPFVKRDLLSGKVRRLSVNQGELSSVILPTGYDLALITESLKG